MKNGLPAEIWEKMANSDRARLLRRRKQLAKARAAEKIRRQRQEDERDREATLRVEREILLEVTEHARLEEFRKIGESANEHIAPVSDDD